MTNPHYVSTPSGIGIGAVHARYNAPGYYAIAPNGVSMTSGPGWDADLRSYRTVQDAEDALRRYDRDRFGDEEP